MTGVMLPAGKYRVMRLDTGDNMEVEISHPFTLLRVFPAGTGLRQFTIDILAFVGGGDEQAGRGTKNEGAQ